jgi:hypothetical protein
MNEIIYQGLKLQSQSGCKYYKVVEGDTISLVEDTKLSTLTLTYTPGSTSWSVSEFLGIDKVGKDQTLEPTNRGIRFSKVYLSLNGLKLEKLVAGSYTFNMIIVGDCESRVIQDSNHTTIVVSQEDTQNQDFINFLFYSGNLLYLRPCGPRPKHWCIKNFPKIIIGDKDISLESSSDTVYVLRRRYDDYVIRAIDYQNQFILELRRILGDYGIELVRWNKEATLKKTSYIVYQFNQTPSRFTHPKYIDEEDHIMSNRVPIEFTLRTPDMPMFFDFKNKYNNLDILTNFCEFKTTDKYGERWTAAVKWQQITEDFNHIYQQDDNSNFSYQCQFRCELYFYEVLDGRYKFLEEIIEELELEGVKYD